MSLPPLACTAHATAQRQTFPGCLLIALWCSDNNAMLNLHPLMGVSKACTVDMR